MIGNDVLIQLHDVIIDIMWKIAYTTIILYGLWRKVNECDSGSVSKRRKCLCLRCVRMRVIKGHAVGYYHRIMTSIRIKIHFIISIKVAKELTVTAIYPASKTSWTAVDDAKA